MTWSVVGQDAALNSLAAAIEHGRVSHAYLFAGPAHVGKALAALEFAQALNCAEDPRPCGACRQCERIAARKHADIEWVTLDGPCTCRPDSAEPPHAPGSRDIRICQIRRIDEIVSRAPFEGAWRVVIIDPADRMNVEAQNALLKTLEEPPPGVVIVLISEREDALLPTVRSRARRILFAGVSRPVLEQALRTRWSVEAQQAQELSRLAGGRIGWAVRALADGSALERLREAVEQAEAVAVAPVSERFLVTAELGGSYARNRDGVHATLEAWQAWWRDLLLVVAGRPGQVVHIERLDSLRALAAQCDVRDAANALRAIGAARDQLDANVSALLALEGMMLAVPRLETNAVTARLGARERA